MPKEGFSRTKWSKCLHCLCFPVKNSYLDFLFLLQCRVGNQPKRDDFVLNMMEDGTIDGILNIVSQMAAMYRTSVPADRVLDELAKLINEEQGTPQDFTATMATLEGEAATLEKILAQLQHDHDELKQMDEARTKSSSENNADVPDAKHALEDKLKKAKVVKNDKIKKK